MFASILDHVDEFHTVEKCRLHRIFRGLSELTDGYWINNGRRVAYQTIFHFYDDGTYESLIYGQINEGIYTCKRGVLSFDSSNKYPYYYDEVTNKWISEAMVLAGGDTYNSDGFYIPLYEIPSTLTKITDISTYYFGGDYTGPSVKTTSEKIIVNIGVLS